MAGAAGFEPANADSKNRCLTERCMKNVGLLRFILPFWGNSDTSRAVLLSNTPISMWDSYVSFAPSLLNQNSTVL